MSAHVPRLTLRASRGGGGGSRACHTSTYTRVRDSDCETARCPRLRMQRGQIAEFACPSKSVFAPDTAQLCKEGLAVFNAGANELIQSVLSTGPGVKSPPRIVSVPSISSRSSSSASEPTWSATSSSARARSSASGVGELERLDRRSTVAWERR